ncbi:CD1871A family CXXC motif-containing protein [Thermosulfuriphilus sp.]
MKKSLFLLALALGLILLGLIHGEYNEVLQRATRLCLSCIGIG